MTENEHTMKVDDVAQLFSIHPQTVRAWTRRGLPCRRVGKFLRFSRRECLQWQDQQRLNTSTSGATPPSTAVPPSATP